VLKSSLVEHHKAERRRRILAAARRLIARHGFDGLTMRDLAEASRVSVPTLYNLFGGKHAILAAELEETFTAIARTLLSSPQGDAVDRAFALYDAGIRELVAVADYYRELVRVFLTDRANDELRRGIDQQFIAAMADNLRAGQAAGQIADWVDAELLSSQLYFQYMVTVLGWARGELDDDQFRAIAHHGLAMLLLGVARGDAQRRVERRARDLQRTLQR
jgi:AcrR family transcriptional regulator